MRVGASATLMMLIACSPEAPSVETKGQAGEGVLMVMCAPANVDRFSPDCTLDSDGNKLTIRHSNGTFRRFLLDGEHGLTTADGADPLLIAKRTDGLVDLEIAGDRYRLDLASLEQDNKGESNANTGRN